MVEETKLEHPGQTLANVKNLQTHIEKPSPSWESNQGHSYHVATLLTTYPLYHPQFLTAFSCVSSLCAKVQQMDL